ncbi:hypothetical protein ACFX2I_041494 [Malus domestica]
MACSPPSSPAALCCSATSSRSTTSKSSMSSSIGFGKSSQEHTKDSLSITMPRSLSASACIAVSNGFDLGLACYSTQQTHCSLCFRLLYSYTGSLT